MNTDFERDAHNLPPQDSQNLPQAYTAPKLAQETDNKLSQNNVGNAMYITLGLLASIVACVIIGIFVYRSAATKFVSALGESYRQASDKVAKETYDRFYENSFNTAQAKNHVKNQVSISVGSLREDTELQVLKVQDVEYAFGTLSNKEEKWLRAKGSAIFTVNLAASEFLVDDARQYVLVRIPKPEAGSFDLKEPDDISPKQNKSFVDQITGIFAGDSTVEGAHLHDKLRSEAYAKLQKTVASSPDFYQVAKDNAIITITNIIKGLNPDIPNLKVEVEFFE